MFKKALISTLIVASIGSASVAFAGDTDPLFINMMSEGPRAMMGLTFGSKQQERGHPLTVFLNDQGVLVAAKSNAGKYPKEQELIAAIQAKGGTVIACPMCMKKHGVKEDDLLPGIKLSSPEVAGNALFKDNTKTLTW